MKTLERKLKDHEYYLANKEKIKEKSMNWYYLNWDKARETRKSWDLKNKDKHTKLKLKWRSNNEKKRKAHFAVDNAIRAEKIKRLPCIKCGKVAHAHHPDYNKQLEIIWLCPYHHSQIHKEAKNEALVTNGD